MERKTVYREKKISLALLPVMFVQPVVSFIRNGATSDSFIYIGISLVYALILFYFIRRPLFIYSPQGITLVRKYGTDDPDHIPLSDITDIQLDGKDKIDLRLDSGKLVYLYPPRNKASEIYVNIKKMMDQGGK